MVGITDRHRLFYVNDKLEFALFYDKSITDKEKIKESFIASRDWIAFVRQFKVKTLKSVEISDDLREVRIIVKFFKEIA